MSEPRHFLFQGDGLALMAAMPPACIDLVLVDPPYGTTSNAWDSVIPLPSMWDALHRVAKPTAAFLFTASQPFSSALVMSNVEEFRHEWVWIKNRGSNFANTVREPMKEHEVILMFSRGKWTYNKQMQARSGSGAARAQYECTFRTESTNYRSFEDSERKPLSQMRVPSSWQKFNTASGKEKTNHPTQKPLELMEYLIKTYSNPGDWVLDFTMGSGTTGVAALNLGRRFVGAELREEYFSVAEARIANCYTK